MEITAKVLWDGEAFHPETPLDLEPGKRYVLTILRAVPSDATERPLGPSERVPCSDKIPKDEGSAQGDQTKEEDAWDVLDRLTGTVEGPGDWSEEHDHYLYGTPKRQGGPVE